MLLKKRNLATQMHKTRNLTDIFWDGKIRNAVGARLTVGQRSLEP